MNSERRIDGSTFQEAVTTHFGRYCRACGGTLVNEASKRVGLCAKCRRFCHVCGRQTGNYGFYNVCAHCRPKIDKGVEYMKAHHGRLPLAEWESPVEEPDEEE